MTELNKSRLKSVKKMRDENRSLEPYFRAEGHELMLLNLDKIVTILEEREPEAHQLSSSY